MSTNNPNPNYQSDPQQQTSNQQYQQNQQYQNQQQYQQPYQQPYVQNNYYQPAPDAYKPISMWGYFGYTFLFSLPILGFILAIIWSFTASNQNLKNYARSQFCWLIIWTILAIILLTTGGLAALVSSF